MTSRESLLALARRCEREEATSTLNIAIARAVGWTSVVLGYVVWRNPSGRDSSLPNFVGSLDAAVGLVPEGWRIYEISQLGPTEHFHVAMITGMPATHDAKGHAKTEAMARCAASLRALAALVKT